jgi:hypothetical protein
MQQSTARRRQAIADENRVDMHVGLCLTPHDVARHQAVHVSNP